jgi:hypothetical protein
MSAEETMNGASTAADGGRTPDCPGGMALMLLHTGDMPGEQQVDLWAHARGCEHCQQVLDGLDQAQQQALELDPFDQAYPRLAARVAELPARDPAVHSRPTSPARAALRRWLALARDPRTWAAVAVATAALALALVLDRGPQPADPARDDELSAAVRAKGKVALDLFALEDGAVTEAEPGTALRPGDRIQFTYTSAGLDHVIVLGADGEGVLTRYYPDRGADSQPIAPGTRMVLEDSIVLDAAPGPEVFVAVFSDEPLPLDAVEEAARAALAAGDGASTALLGLTLPPSLDGAVAATWVTKELEEGDWR